MTSRARTALVRNAANDGVVPIILVMCARRPCFQPPASQPEISYRLQHGCPTVKPDKHHTDEDSRCTACAPAVPYAWSMGCRVDSYQHARTAGLAGQADAQNLWAGVGRPAPWHGSRCAPAGAPLLVDINTRSLLQQEVYQHASPIGPDAYPDESASSRVFLTRMALTAVYYCSSSSTSSTGSFSSDQQASSSGRPDLVRLLEP